MTTALDHVRALRRLRRRAAAVPVASTVAASALALWPGVPGVPLLPPTGLLMLIGWRLLRAELWQAWIGLPLGLADDLLSGRPPGTAMVSWTAILLLIDAGEDRMAWRGRWEEWLLAGVGCGVATLWAWGVARFTGGEGAIAATAPALAAAILLFPLVQRLCAALDRWRLSR